VPPRVIRSVATSYQVSRRDYFVVHAFKSLVRAHGKPLLELEPEDRRQLRAQIADEAVAASEAVIAALERR
jgi:hypothetical protein